MEQTEALKKQMIAVAQALHNKNMLAAADGNISYRISDDEILITPTGKPKALITPNDIAIINLNNDIIDGAQSSERLMHLTVYEKCPKARCVIQSWDRRRPFRVE